MKLCIISSKHNHISNQIYQKYFLTFLNNFSFDFIPILKISPLYLIKLPNQKSK